MNTVKFKRAIIKIGSPIIFPLVKVWWLIRPHTMKGAKAVLYTSENILLVKHTFGSDKWKLPGGQIKRDESPENAIQRELEEELGINPATLYVHGTTKHVTKSYHDTVYVFSGQIGQQTEFSLGPEIETVRWVSKDNVPFSDMSEMTKKAVILWQTLTIV